MYKIIKILCVRTQVYINVLAVEFHLAFFEVQPVRRRGHDLVKNVTCLGSQPRLLKEILESPPGKSKIIIIR